VKANSWLFKKEGNDVLTKPHVELIRQYETLNTPIYLAAAEAIRRTLKNGESLRTLVPYYQHQAITADTDKDRLVYRQIVTDLCCIVGVHPLGASTR